MDYRIEALDVLLHEDCILERYLPLIPYKERLINSLRQRRCLTKSQCQALSDDLLLEMGLPDGMMVGLFRRFLVMYDVKNSKMKEIDLLAEDAAEAASFQALYLLPGVKATRARLYCAAGYRTLERIAAADPEQIIRETSDAILRNGWTLKAPAPKEVRTHIAVAKALTVYAA